MSVKYAKLSTEDPEEGRASAFEFNSVFTYDRPDYFSYGKPSSNKYRSAFTYQGINANKTTEVTVGKYQINLAIRSFKGFMFYAFLIS